MVKYRTHILISMLALVLGFYLGNQHGIKQGLSNGINLQKTSDEKYANDNFTTLSHCQDLINQTVKNNVSKCANAIQQAVNQNNSRPHFCMALPNYGPNPMGISPEVCN